MKKVAVAFALVLVSIALVACGGSSSDNGTTTEPTPETGAAESGKEAGGASGEEGGASGEEGGAEGGGATLSFEADPGGGLAFTTTKATAKAGEVTIDFNNPQGLQHDVAIEDSSGKTIGETELVAEGEDSTVVDLKPGTYHFYCTVPGHREGGMEGTLTVK